jgi:uncharacterized iron-regulated membrane protein
LLNRQTAVRNLARHAFATLACLLFVFLWLTAGNPDALSPWIEALTRPDRCVANPTACAQQPPTGNAATETRTAFESSVPGQAEPPADDWRMPRSRGGS